VIHAKYDLKFAVLLTEHFITVGFVSLRIYCMTISKKIMVEGLFTTILFNCSFCD